MVATFTLEGPTCMHQLQFMQEPYSTHCRGHVGPRHAQDDEAKQLLSLRVERGKDGHALWTEVQNEEELIEIFFIIEESCAATKSQKLSKNKAPQTLVFTWIFIA